MTIPVNQWQILLFRKIDPVDCPRFPSKSPKKQSTVLRGPHNRARPRVAASPPAGAPATRPLHVVITGIAPRRRFSAKSGRLAGYRRRPARRAVQHDGHPCAIRPPAGPGPKRPHRQITAAVQARERQRPLAGVQDGDRMAGGSPRPVCTMRSTASQRPTLLRAAGPSSTMQSRPRLPARGLRAMSAGRASLQAATMNQL